MESLILHNVDRNELSQIISEALSDQINNLGLSRTIETSAPKYLTREEAALELRISLPTLHLFTQTGKIKGYRIGGRVLYKSNEIEAGLISISNK